ncbi:hypothetical protein BJY00DRAFT_220211 [Aspergillus carlsbadensis]|nr:hypothetical protein BJY00DRAFT_220211 [Aspergillus carlsbadensis]
MIWHPQRPSESTHAELVRWRPSIIYQVAGVCIRADYRDTFDSLEVVPDVWLVIDPYRYANQAQAGGIGHRYQRFRNARRGQGGISFPMCAVTGVAEK